jgi:serine/threonine protein kinase
LSDFKIIKLLGTGTFGKVYLVQDKRKGFQYAMKSIRKDTVIKHESIESLEVEKMILLKVKHPFIISMDYVFVLETRVYFIMQYVEGGDIGM